LQRQSECSNFATISTVSLNGMAFLNPRHLIMTSFTLVRIMISIILRPIKRYIPSGLYCIINVNILHDKLEASVAGAALINLK
jgi:hypothetical protein